MNTNIIKAKTIPKAIRQTILTIICTSSLILTLNATQTFANGLPKETLRDYSANNIYFYQPCDFKNSGNFSSICGNTAREKYWSALRQYFSDVQTAAIFGSIDHEGSFGPTLWQYTIVPAGSGQFKSGITWDQLYNCENGKCPGGVGAFQITWELGSYLRQINDKNPDLIKYFKDPTYSLPGDQLLEKIGATDFDRLVTQEIELFVLGTRKGHSDNMKKYDKLDDATDYWTSAVENCKNCCGEADDDHSCEQIELRRASAKKRLDEMKPFTCNSSSSSSVSSPTSANTSQYTLLEGYGNLTFYGPDAASNGGYAGRNGTDSINGGALADGQVARDTRDGGQLAFGDVIYIETTPDTGAESSHANGKFFIVADTGGETAHSAKWDIDVFVDEPNPSALNYPPYGSTTDAKVYKVASGVSWDDFLAQYYGKTSVQTTSNPCSDNSFSSTGNAIADVALQLSWDCGADKGCHSQGSPPYTPKPEYETAMQQVDTYDNPGGWGYGASCDRFVATVMRYSKADENFPIGYANESGNYMINHPELYEEINFNGSNFEVLQPGDIFSTFGAATSGGHIWAYVTINGEHGRADASNGNSSGRTAEHYTRTPIINDGRQYKVFRRK